MSRRIQFPTGLYQALIGWETLDFEWVLMAGTWDQDETVQIFMADVVADEFVDTDYVRVPLTTPVAGVIELAGATGQPGIVGYTSDPPAFPAMSDGGTAESLLLINVVTTDADSPLVACAPILYVANGTSPSLPVAATGTVSVYTVC